MLRLWLHRDDLARIRFAAAPSPLATVMLSAQPVRGGHGPLYDRWRRRTLGALPPRVRALFELVPATGYIPDFLTPVVRGCDLDAELEALRSTPRRRILADLAGRHGARSPGGLARRLLADDQDAWHTLTRAVRGYYDTVLAADWARLRAHHRADVSHRARLTAVRGVDGMLASLHPAVRRNGSVLEIDGLRDGDVHLDGRGLLLVPSVFTGPTPRFRAYADGDQPAALVYPARQPYAVWEGRRGDHPDALAALVGQTRAAILRELDTDDEYTTGGLAVRLSISASTASQHATTLRAAGLVSTERRGQAVFHRLTPFGESLLAATGGTVPDPA